MCQLRSTKKGFMSPLPIKFAKVTVVLIFFFFAECAAGSCLSYGHACWGAHGKRSNSRSDVPLREGPFNKDLANTRWFLSRLVQSPFDLRFLRGREFDMPTRQRANEQLFADAQTLKGREEWDNDPDLSDDSTFEEMAPLPLNNLMSSKNKRSVKI